MIEVLDTRVDMQLHSCNLSDIFVSFTDGNSLGQPGLAFKKSFTKAQCTFESGQHTGPNDILCPLAVLHSFWQLFYSLVHPLYSTIQEPRCWVCCCGPVIQANGRLTFEDDLRSWGLLCFTTQWTSVRTELVNSMVTLGEPGVERCQLFLQDTSRSTKQHRRAAVGHWVSLSVKCCRMVDSVPRRRLSPTNWPI